MAYEADLGGVAQRMQDNAQMGAGRFLFSIGELIEHIHTMDGSDESVDALRALACSAAFAWLLDEQAV